MKKLEWNWLRMECFVASEYKNQKMATLFFMVMGALAGIVVGVLPMVLLDIFLLSGGGGAAGAVGMLSCALMGLTTPFWGRAHVLSGFPDEKYYYLSDRATTYAKRYYELPKSERAEIPVSAINLLKEPSLSKAQRTKLKASLKQSMSLAEQRLSQKKQIEVKRVDISDVLSELEAGRAMLKSDTDTYKEFL